MDPTWKMLVYISADNTLYKNAQLSLRQLTEASAQNNVEVIVQLDGPSSDQVSRYKCAGGSKQLIWQALDNYTEDRAQRLRDFLGLYDVKPSEATNSFAARASEKQKIALIPWGHGAGLDHLFFYKDPPGQEALSPVSLPLRARVEGLPTPGAEDANRYVKNIELANILLAFKEKNFGRKIDVLGLDSCLMGMAEICVEFSDSVSLMVASDEQVPKGSWPYDTILSDLNKHPLMDGNALSRKIIDRFMERYTQKGNETRISLSCMSLSGSDKLIKKMSELVNELSTTFASDTNGSVRRRIFRARDASRTPDEVTYIDFGVFCKELSESFSKDRAEISTLASEIHDLLLNTPYILYHRDAGEDGSIDPSGIAIYFPQTLDSITSEINKALKEQPLPPAADVKFGGSNKDKFPDGSQITGYEILWQDYTKLKFNEKTQWACLIFRLLDNLAKYCSACGAKRKAAGCAGALAS